MKNLTRIPCLKTLPNVVYFPDPTTLRPLPWAGGDKFQVAEVLGTTYMCEDATLKAHYSSRDILINMLKRLELHGISVSTGTEMKFSMLPLGSSEPQYAEPSHLSQLTFSLQEDVLFYVEKQLHNTGVGVDQMHVESAPGQCEFTIWPCEGIKAADNVFLFKNAVKELARKKGMLASFVSRRDADETGNSMNFNISLWDEQGKNISYDSSERNQLSATAHHWIAGLVKHADAITALCAPTVNCYRRLYKCFGSGVANWGLDNKDICYRVKHNGEKGTYIENHITSALANPYLALAATLAAGLDGIENKLECPPMEDKMAKPIPTNLTEALIALENDAVIKGALGEDLVSAFIDTKKECELPRFANHDVKSDNPDEISAEVLFYERLM